MAWTDSKTKRYGWLFIMFTPIELTLGVDVFLDRYFLVELSLGPFHIGLHRQHRL